MPYRDFLGPLALSVSLLAQGAALGETVTFESGAKPPSPFQIRLAKNQGRPVPKGVPGIEVKGELAKPNGDGPHPAIVILHTCDGVMKHVSRDWPAFLNGLGYATLTVDSFGSRNLGACPNGLKHTTMLDDAFGALDFLARQDFIDAGRIGVFGFSKGGVVVNEMAATQYRVSSIQFRAGVSFYGPCETLLGVEHQLHMPIIEIIGEHDPETAACRNLGASAKLMVTELPDAHHGFDVQESSGRTNARGTEMRYSAEAAAMAREIAKAFLSRHF